MRTLILASAAGALLTLSACDQALLPTVAGIAGSTAGTGAVRDTTALVVSPGHVQIAVGASAQLGVNAPSGAAVQWASSETSIAVVSATGLVTGLRPGTAVITAQLVTDPTRVAAATVDVLPGTSGGNP
jgi:uncharacterized protein YjdB